jgi:hypothetical protein
MTSFVLRAILIVSLCGVLVEPSRAQSGTETLSFTSAPGETVYFGGTTWNAALGRWEAIRDSVWTFDSGIGSHFNHNAPGVQPHKSKSLHAYMEGWVGVDHTYPVPLIKWRRVSARDPRWNGDGCVGRIAGLGGQWSAWLGAFQDEADSLCYVTGRGYGNDWHVSLAKRFYYPGTGSLQLTYDYITDISQDSIWDDLWIQIQRPPEPDFPNGSTYELWNSYWQPAAGRNTLSVPAYMLPDTPDSFTIAFTFMSDRSWPDYLAGSDEDGLYDSQCSVALDNITLSGVISETTDFESGNNGWGFLPLPEPWPYDQFGGEWSDIADLSTLPPMQIPCALRDSVLVFDDHEPGSLSKIQDNYVLSPWIDLERENATGAAHYFIESDLYYNLPVSVYTYIQVGVEWEPDDCVLGAAFGPSPVIMDRNGSFYIVPKCFTPFRWDVTNLIPPQAKAVRIALGLWSDCYVRSECRYWWDPDARFDNVRLGVVRSVTGVPPDDQYARSARLLVSPNPVRSGKLSRLSLLGVTDKTAILELFDIAGRRIRSWNVAVGKEESWTAVDGSGDPLGSGVFYLRWNAGVSHGTTKILVLSP